MNGEEDLVLVVENECSDSDEGEGENGNGNGNGNGNICEILDFVNPWDFKPIFDLDECNRIKELGRYASKKAVRLAIFGAGREFNDDEEKEFSKWYSEGAAEGEVAISVKLFSAAMAGDKNAINQYLIMKNGWNADSANENDDDEAGFNIYLSDGNLGEI